MSAEQETAARSFRELGNALVVLARRRGRVSKDIESLGHELRRVQPRDVADGRKLLSLRQPLDQLREVIEGLHAFTSEIRSVAEALATIIGVDN